MKFQSYEEVHGSLENKHSELRASTKESLDRMDARLEQLRQETRGSVDRMQLVMVVGAAALGTLLGRNRR